MVSPSRSLSAVWHIASVSKWPQARALRSADATSSALVKPIPACHAALSKARWLICCLQSTQRAPRRVRQCTLAGFAAQSPCGLHSCCRGVAALLLPFPSCSWTVALGSYCTLVGVCRAGLARSVHHPLDSHQQFGMQPQQLPNWARSAINLVMRGSPLSAVRGTSHVPWACFLRAASCWSVPV